MSPRDMEVILVEEPDFTPENIAEWNKTNEPNVHNNKKVEYSDDVCKQLGDGIKATLAANKSPVEVSGGTGYEIVKRIFDIVVSLIVLPFVILIMIVFGIIIFAHDGGSPLFIQTRFTKDGKPFKMLKLRSMVIDAEARKEEAIKEDREKNGENEGNNQITTKLTNDSRITPIGEFIRKTSIDEIPQFFNVLFGQMTLVGPRPAIPSEIANYEPRHMERMRVKAGLTCYHQCEARGDNDFEKWLESDFRYIRKRSLSIDLKILYKTAIAVIKKDGAK